MRYEHGPNKIKFKNEEIIYFMGLYYGGSIRIYDRVFFRVRDIMTPKINKFGIHKTGNPFENSLKETLRGDCFGCIHEFACEYAFNSIECEQEYKEVE